LKEIRRKIYKLFDDNFHNHFFDKILIYIISALVILNITAIVLESVHSIFITYQNYFSYFEHFFVLMFTIEYFVRLWVIKENPNYAGKYGRIKYIFSWIALIDLVSILPYFLGFNYGPLRLLRILKLERYSKGLKKIIEVLKNKRQALLTSTYLSIFGILISSSVIYFAEHDAQPEKFSSIPESIYWSIITLTTIGYGDFYPITLIGKICTCFIAVMGIGLLALPTAIIVSGFFEKDVFCPKCNQKIESK
jgi:voltage-gated potassium channel